MLYRYFEPLNQEVSALCLGTQEFSQVEGWWGTGKIEEYQAIIDFALEAGLNFIDTAEVYGESEHILGRLLKGKRNKVILASKIFSFEWDYTTIYKKLVTSLKRLDTDYLDLYMVHWPKIKGFAGQTTGMQTKDYEEIHQTLLRLKEQGLIRVGGVSNFRLEHLQRFKDEAFDVITVDQVPYNLLWHAYAGPAITGFCQDKGMSFLAYASLAQGLLTGQYTAGSDLTPVQRGNVLFNEPVYGQAMQIVEVVRQVATELDATPAQVVLKWVLDQEPVLAAVVGVRNVSELEQNVAAVDLNITEEQMDRLSQASYQFWKRMPDDLELWIPDNSHNISSLEAIGLSWHEWDYYERSESKLSNGEQG